MNFSNVAFAKSSVWVSLSQSDSVHCFWRTLQEVPFHI